MRIDKIMIRIQESNMQVLMIHESMLADNDADGKDATFTFTLTV